MHGIKHASHGKDGARCYAIVQTDRTFTYDDAGKLLSSTETEEKQGTYTYTYEYDSMGNRTLEQKKNKCGKVVEYSKYLYNDSNQLISEETYNGKKTSKLSYTYDADGNRISETGKIGCKKVNKTYEYSVENRLEAVYDGKTLLMAAAYDGDGNRVFQLNYNPDEKNACCNKNFDKHPTACNRNPKTNGQQMPVKDDCKNDGGKDASKDRTGCQSGSQFGQIRCTDGSEDVPERKPDNFHQKEEHSCGILIPEKEEISETEEALLDKIKGWGNKKNYELTEYINDVNREYTEVLVEQNISGKMETAYVYGNERLSSDCCNGRSSYYLYDPRGSVTGITNEDGKIYQSYRYNAFGEITFGAPEHENAYTYNGESYNPNIESQYLRARYYDVTTGSFLTEDSYLGDINQPLTLNRYNYCGSNPVNYQDPSGHFWDTVLDILSLIDSYNTYKKDKTDENKAMVVLDVVCLIVPVLSGGGIVGKFIKGANKLETASDMKKTGNVIEESVETFGDANKKENLIEAGQEAIEQGEKSADELIEAGVNASKTAPEVVNDTTRSDAYKYLEKQVQESITRSTLGNCENIVKDDKLFKKLAEDSKRSPRLRYNLQFFAEDSAEIAQNSSNTLKKLMTESDAATKWGILDNGTNQGVKHFNEYWDKYPERIPSLEKRLGLAEGTFDNTLEGFNNFTEEAERVVREATIIGNVRNVNGKSIYYIDGLENVKKGVAVIVKDGKIQSMMPSDFKSFSKMQ